MRTTRLIAAALLFALAVGCASQSNESPTGELESPSPESSQAAEGGGSRSIPASEGLRPSAAKRALRRAVKTMRYDEVTHFDVMESFGAGVFAETHGVITGSGWEATQETTSQHSDGPFVMEARSTENTVWMQMKGWPPNLEGCWLQMGASQVPVGIQAMRPDEPMYFTVLGYLATSGFEDFGETVMVGDLRADVATNLLRGQLFAELGLDGLPVTMRVPIEIGYDGERVSYIEFEGSDLLQMMENTGRSASAIGRASLEKLSVRINYSLYEELPAIYRPPAALIITEADLTSADGGCH